MLYWFAENSGAIILVSALVIFFYFLITGASRLEKIREKRLEIMQRAKKLQERMHQLSNH